MLNVFRWIIGTTSTQEVAEHQRETRVPLLHTDQQQASTGKPSHSNSSPGTLPVFNESEKGENPSPRLSFQLETRENCVGESHPELETRENFGEEPCPEIETSKSFGDELWSRPLHMNPADNSKEEDISKGSPLHNPKQ